MLADGASHGGASRGSGSVASSPDGSSAPYEKYATPLSKIGMNFSPGTFL